MDVRQRTATLADYSQMHALYQELVGPGGVISGPEGRQRFEQILSHPGTAIACVEFEGRLVAAATVHILPNMTVQGRPYALIENVVTLRAMQGRGLGRKVMDHARDLAWAADCYKIMLLTGREVGARAFYEKLGYTAEDKWGMTLRRVPKRRL